MKKKMMLIFAMIVFIALVIYVQSALGKDVEWMQSKTQQIKMAFDDQDRAQVLFAEMLAKWDVRELFWSMLLPHDNLQDVRQEMGKLGIALQNSNREDASQAIEAIHLTMQHLLGRNTLRWDHIL